MTKKENLILGISPFFKNIENIYALYSFVYIFKEYLYFVSTSIHVNANIYNLVCLNT